MMVSTPHYLLCSETSHGCGAGQWRFTLRTADGLKLLEAADDEPAVGGERLDLLTVVRALEALDQPSRVTLLDCSPYVRQGIRYGLPEWRSNGWRWEYFGQMVPVKNGDLWQRLDRAMRFHHVECRRRRFDSAHAWLPGPNRTPAGREESVAPPLPAVEPAGQARPVHKCQPRIRRPLDLLGAWRTIIARLRVWRRRVVQAGGVLGFYHLLRAGR